MARPTMPDPLDMSRPPFHYLVGVTVREMKEYVERKRGTETLNRTAMKLQVDELRIILENISEEFPRHVLTRFVQRLRGETAFSKISAEEVERELEIRLGWIEEFLDTPTTPGGAWVLDFFEKLLEALVESNTWRNSG
jgi:hypothetical protein